jgi:hypothetical protein
MTEDNGGGVKCTEVDSIKVLFNPLPVSENRSTRALLLKRLMKLYFSLFVLYC